MADAAHARPLVEANRTQQSCGLRRHNPEGPNGCARIVSWPVPIRLRSQLRRPSQKRLAHFPKEVSRSARLATGADRPGDGSFFLGGCAATGVGRTWDGSKPGPFSWDRVTLNPFAPPTHRRDALLFATTAVEIVGRGRRPIKASGCLGYSRTPAAESMLPCLVGSSCRLAPSGSRWASARRPRRDLSV